MPAEPANKMISVKLKDGIVKKMHGIDARDAANAGNLAQAAKVKPKSAPANEEKTHASVPKPPEPKKDEKSTASPK